MCEWCKKEFENEKSWKWFEFVFCSAICITRYLGRLEKENVQL